MSAHQPPYYIGQAQPPKAGQPYVIGQAQPPKAGQPYVIGQPQLQQPPSRGQQTKGVHADVTSVHLTPPKTDVSTHNDDVKTGFGLAIFSCFCLLWCCSVKAIKLSMQSRDALAAHDVETAKTRGEESRAYACGTIVGGVICWVLIVALTLFLVLVVAPLDPGISLCKTCRD